MTVTIPIALLTILPTDKNTNMTIKKRNHAIIKTNAPTRIANFGIPKVKLGTIKKIIEKTSNIIIYRWCSLGDDCYDDNCDLKHPSDSLEYEPNTK